MANFRTHLGVAAVGGVVVAHGGWQAGLWDAWQALPILALVALGGILPDIDADNSRSIRLVFNLLAVLAAVLGGGLMQEYLGISTLLVACSGVYLGVRYLGAALFARFTVHRGLWHSLLAAAFSGLTTAALSYRFLAQPASLAWGHGVALALGFVLHLLLDELYSVDLIGGRIKRSFGTALKPLDWRSPGNSLVMFAAGANLLPWLPPWPALRELLVQGVSFWR
ncbi:MAG TPA: metal-dependent hydrolase [Halomonas sp.]|nr:metal-dependent hydrolase [Halomonas sp.]